jgi:peptidoglycan-associated lipoprotein
MKWYYIIIWMLSIPFLSCISAKERKAMSDFNNLNYHKSALAYENILEEKYDSTYLPVIGQCYYKSNELDKAAYWYDLADKKNTLHDIDLYYYAQILKSQQEHINAKIYYNRYLLQHPNDQAAILQRNSIDSTQQYHKDDEIWQTNYLSFNDKYSNFSPTLYDNGLVFCSDRDNDGKISNWNGKPYLNLYHTQWDENGELNNTHDLSKKIESTYHEGPAVFTKDNNTLYFCKNVLSKSGKPLKNEKGDNIISIYMSTREGDNWSKPFQLPFCDENYSCMHPALSHDENTLYFSSDRPGGFGGMDLYMITKTNGEWGEPFNLGHKINTRENDVFPTVAMSKEYQEFLYYSTAGKGGVGGMDIFYTALNSPMPSGEVKHFNSPINSEGDDFGLVWKEHLLKGYISTTRNNRNGIDKIYEIERLIPKFYLEIYVLNKKTRARIENAEIEIDQTSGNKIYKTRSDEKGMCFLEIDSNSTYEITARKEMFFNGIENTGTLGKRRTDTMEVVVLLDPMVIEKPIILENIFYDFDKWNIRPDAAIELDKLVKTLNEHPEISIELSSHADCRGSDDYNLRLTSKRAKSAVDYIIKKGIGSFRIKSKGYGESKLVNQCKDGVECSEDEHQKNRRTEFKITKILKK